VHPIRLRGARTHNLKRIDLDLKPGELVVIAGPSGAGKSSLAFDTLYAEGQRRYVESFSTYARQFLERMVHPPVDALDDVPAAMAVDRQAPVKSSRSTVGTMTDLVDYTKDLWAAAATLQCDACGRQVTADTPEGATRQALLALPGQRAYVTYSLEICDAEAYVFVREALVKEGFFRVLVDGELRDLQALRPSEVVPYRVKGTKKTKVKTSAKSPRIEVLVDRVTLNEESAARLREALGVAFKHGHGSATVRPLEGSSANIALHFSNRLHCAYCDKTYASAAPSLFSFNNPVGACETCRGFGRIIAIDWDRVLPDPRLTLRQGAVRPWTGKSTQWERDYLLKNCTRVGLSVDKPLGELSQAERTWLIEGDSKDWKRGWPGLRGWFEWLETRTYKMHVRVLLSRYRKYDICNVCEGSRLRPESSLWKISGKSISEFWNMPITDALAFVERLESDGKTGEAQDDAVRGACAVHGAGHTSEVCTYNLPTLKQACVARLGLINQLGLGYLTLSRASRTLSGGEAQRVALAGALGTSLASALFVLDEPTVGLHPSDTQKLVGVLHQLTRADNIALIVEHDADVIRLADRVIELGPEAGPRGGQIVYDGPPSELSGKPTATGRMLGMSYAKQKRRKPQAWIQLQGANGNNLRNVELKLPLRAFTVVTGVSGSGKTSLIIETLIPALQNALGELAHPLPFTALTGAEQLSSVSFIDQSPMGRTSRGNPATYLKVWDVVRKRYAGESSARERELSASFFSFNVAGGRCETCKGEGAETVEMQFMADVTFPCPVCQGMRFNADVLGVLHRGKHVADLLKMSLDDVAALYADDKDVCKALAPALEMGLGYLQLGQPLNTLSLGEGQRLKLARLFTETKPGGLIVLDEPSAGLHQSDIQPLLQVLQRRVDAGDTVVVIEHNMHVARAADYVIDLGPGAGLQGGEVVAAGTPEQLVRSTRSVTAPFLAINERASEQVQRLQTDLSLHQTSSDGAVSIRGAREHNLKHVSVEIPREKLVVVTGPSGSGKSSLVFDVLFAEAQRRYLETLSPYARQYMPQLPRPVVEAVDGVAPSIALHQRLNRPGANSTVATLTEVAHYLRLLYAKLGTLHCPQDGTPITPADPDTLIDTIRRRFAARSNIEVSTIVMHSRKGAHRELLTKLRRGGAEYAFIDGERVKLKSGLSLDRYREHTIEAVIGSTAVNAVELATLLRSALSRGRGTVMVRQRDESLLLSTERTCVRCGTGYPELDPRFFSFNTTQGACATCNGSGVVEQGRTRGRKAKTAAVWATCSECQGTRLSQLARSVLLKGQSIDQWFALSIEAAQHNVAQLVLGTRETAIGAPIIEALARRLALLNDLGVGYLELHRAANSLSGGEVQRVRLSAQLASGQTGILYVLDEPTIGLHPRDTHLLIRAFRQLTQRGCSVVVVEHDLDVIRSADHVIDMGPSGGQGGGQVIATGAPALFSAQASATARALNAEVSIPHTSRIHDATKRLRLSGVSHHNLKNVDVEIPHGALTVVTGVSGSGKSSLVRQVLYPAVRAGLEQQALPPGTFCKLEGLAPLRRALEVDQSPIGRTPRSVPATYLGIWDLMRKLLAATPDARARGFTAAHFSFNSGQGRCPTCAGQASIAAQMSFLPDAELDCPACRGARFTPDILEIRWHELNAAQVLELEVSRALEVFADVSSLTRPLKLLDDLGLGYLKLGQPSNTLSGGEAQRLKLVTELSGRVEIGPTLYVLDEPTTGLHRQDVTRLITVLQAFADRGDTVVVVEHQPDVMLCADWLIDLGPEGGERGGYVQAQTTPEQLIASFQTHTA